MWGWFGTGRTDSKTKAKKYLSLAGKLAELGNECAISVLGSALEESAHTAGLDPSARQVSSELP